MNNEYLTSNEQIAYPFVEGAAGLAPEMSSGSVGSPPYLPRDFLLDAVAVLRSGAESLHLRSVSRQLNGIYVLTFSDNLSDIFIATRSYSGLNPAGRDTVHLTDDLLPTPGIGEDIFIDIVTGPGFLPYILSIPVGTTINFGTRLRLETAAVETRPDRIRSFASSSGTGWIYLLDEIEFAEGYNCDLSVGEEGLVAAGRDGTQVTIALSPGLGTGRYPCAGSSSTDYIAAISGVVPDENGNITLSTDGCHKVMPLHDASTNEIHIENECVSPCTCDQYAAMVEALKGLYDRAESVKQTLDVGVASLNADIVKFNAGNCDSKAKKIILVEGTVGMDGSGKANNHCIVDMPMTLMCMRMPSVLKARLAITGMAAATPMFGKVMGMSLSSSSAIAITVNMTSDDIVKYLSGPVWYTVPPNLLAGPFIEIKVGLTVPVSSSANCTSAIGTYSYGAFIATAKGKW